MRFIEAEAGAGCASYRAACTAHTPLGHMGSSEPHSEETEAIIQSARKEYACDDVEIDDVPCVSHADDGTWVMGWLWVEKKEAANAI